jgi:hypothetical protein
MFSVVSHTGTFFLPLYPTAQKNLLQCVPQRRRAFIQRRKIIQDRVIFSNFKCLSLT